MKPDRGVVGSVRGEEEEEDQARSNTTTVDSSSSSSIVVGTEEDQLHSSLQYSLEETDHIETVVLEDTNRQGRISCSGEHTFVHRHNQRGAGKNIQKKTQPHPVKIPKTTPPPTSTPGPPLKNSWLRLWHSTWW